MLYATFTPSTSAEAYIGNFSNINFNKEWNVTLNGEDLGKHDLPHYVNCQQDDQLVIKKILPSYLSNGMSIMFRTALEDVYVYINGHLRTSYASDEFKNMSYYLPSAYILVPLYYEDIGKEIEIHYTVKSTGVLNSITMGQGVAPWFDILKSNYILVCLAVSIIIMGALLAISYDILRRKFKTNKAIYYLSLIMINMGLWILSESKLRQLIFSKPSLSSIFAYLCIELLGIFILLYFDEIQYRMHHKVYVQLEFLVTLQIILNSVLNFTDIAPFRETLIYSHIWLITGILIIIINILIDWYHHQVSRYKAIITGMGIFLIFGAIEIYNFYYIKGSTLGVPISIGFMIFMFANIVQLFRDITAEYEKNQRKTEESWFNTIKTIAGAIEAKDEYTGGHSERVAYYATVLAKYIAKDYGFTDEDFAHIHHVGLLHDIGKIGIPDDILNKTGRLTDEEFSLMKKHVEIGSLLMKRANFESFDLTEGIRYHHERYDGKGYPDGLKGIKIPLIARILCLADSYDAMTSSRVYRKRLTDEEVLNEFNRCSGSQFDPDLCKAFIELLGQGKLQPPEKNNIVAIDERTTLRSMILEAGLKKEKISHQNEVINLSRIRFACYVMKMAESAGQNFEVFFIELKKDLNQNEYTTDLLTNIPKEVMSPKDMNLRYSDNSNLLVLFDRTPEELHQIIAKLSEKLTIITLGNNATIKE